MEFTQPNKPVSPNANLPVNSNEVKPKKANSRMEWGHFRKPASIFIGIVALVAIAYGAFLYREQLTTLVLRSSPLSGLGQRGRSTTSSTSTSGSGTLGSGGIIEAAQQAAGPNMCAAGGKKPWGEYFEYYNYDPRKSATSAGIEPEDYRNNKNNVWYGEGINKQTTWDENGAKSIGPNQYGNPIGSAHGGQLKEVAVGEEFGYVGMTWPAHGSWIDGNDPQDPYAGTYKALGADNTNYVGPCPDWYFVYEYDPAVISVDAAAGGVVAWWKPGQIAFYRNMLVGCYAHCSPSDAGPLTDFNIKARFISQPTSTDYRPFTLHIIHRGFQLDMPNTLDGNEGKRPVPMDQDGWRWQLQKALQVKTDAQFANNLQPAKLASTAEIIAKVGAASRSVQKNNEASKQLLLYPIDGFVTDPQTRSMYIIDAIKGENNLSVSQSNIFVPSEHIIAQNQGREKLAQGILGYGLAPTVHGIYLSNQQPTWPQETGFDFKSNRNAISIVGTELVPLPINNTNCNYSVSSVPHSGDMTTMGGVTITPGKAGDIFSPGTSGTLVSMSNAMDPLSFPNLLLAQIDKLKITGGTSSLLDACAAKGYQRANFSL